MIRRCRLTALIQFIVIVIFVAILIYTNNSAKTVQKQYELALQLANEREELLGEQYRVKVSALLRYIC